MMICESKIQMPPEAIAPDSYNESYGITPQNDFVVSRNRDGSIASYYGDRSWDLSPYDPEGRSKWLHFPFWADTHLTAERDLLARESRWIMFLLIWKQHGHPLSYKSLNGYLHAITGLAKYGEREACTLKEILTEPDRLLGFIDSGISGTMIATISYLHSILFNIGPEQTNGYILTSGQVLKEVQKRAEVFRLTWKQHPPIPTRIYSAIIAGLIKELDDFESIAANYFALVEECSRDQFLGRHPAVQKKTAKRLCIDECQFRPDFKSMLLRYDLKHYFSEKKLSLSVKGLSTGLTCIQKNVKLLIQVFSGMRDFEALSLPYHCLEITKANGRTHCLVLGRTTKLNQGQVKRVRWVTSAVGHRAIKLAMLIADVIYRFLNEEPIKSGTRANNFPLFISPAYLPLSGTKIFIRDGRYMSARLEPGSLAHFEKLKLQFMPVIEDGDLNELEQIDPHRAWRSEEKFKIGGYWPLTSHQLRRSLALYAQRSGLVSLPSLRRQLQHITEEMSLYYARGSAYAQNFIGSDKEHFGLEWQNSEPVSAALSYMLNVFHSEEKLFGGHIDWLKKNLCGADGTILLDREETLRRFKKGELAYKETFLGGCANTGACKQTALNWLDVDCLVGCTNLVASLPRLERIIIAQTRFVNSLDPTSIEFRTENADLDVLISTRNKVLNQQRLELEAA